MVFASRSPVMSMMTWNRRRKIPNPCATEDGGRRRQDMQSTPPYGYLAGALLKCRTSPLYTAASKARSVRIAFSS
jgi:hypothetical protein